MSFGLGLSRFQYVVQRAGRNLLPNRAASLARRLLGDIAGGESYAPVVFTEHYVESLTKAGRSLARARVLLFGQGPSLGFACHLLAAGAEHLYLFDPYAPPDDRANAKWLDQFPEYLERGPAGIRPRERWMTLLGGETPSEIGPVADVVISSSVFEHLDDIDRWAGELARSTGPRGVNVHMIDLRDHFFHMPFEMLKYSSSTWERWLDPRQHLNRARLWEYESAFRNHFGEVSIEVLERDPERFEIARSRIRPEFLSGDAEVDSVTEIEVTAAEPIRSG